MPSFVDFITSLRGFVSNDVLQRFLDVYDVRFEDLQEASLGYLSEGMNDSESLKTLKLHQTRSATLRRLALCCLLSIDATGHGSDTSIWSVSVDQMEKLSQIVGKESYKLNCVLHQDEFLPSSPMTSPRPAESSNIARSPLGVAASNASSPVSPSSSLTSSSSQHLYTTLRRLQPLSQQIRTLQAKLQLLREDSSRALSTPTCEEELATLSSSLNEKYDGLGADLQTLMRAWEEGREALKRGVLRQSRRVSRSNSLMAGSRDASKAIGHSLPAMDLVSVNEAAPTDFTFPKSSPPPQIGPMPLSPPVTEDGSATGASGSERGVEDEDEVFEGVSSSPTSRHKAVMREQGMLSRGKRIEQMRQEREKMAIARAKREEGLLLVRELKSVIGSKKGMIEKNQDIRRVDLHRDSIHPTDVPTVDGDDARDEKHSQTTEKRTKSRVASMPVISKLASIQGDR